MKKSLTKIIIMTFRGLIYGTAMQVFFLSMMLAKGSEAQNIQSVRDVTISIDLKDANLNDCFTEIEKKTVYRFSYDHYMIDATVKINYKSNKKSVSDLLMEISKQASLKFKQINNNINVQKLENTDQESQLEIIIQGTTITGKVTDENGEGLPGVNVIVKGTALGTVTDIEGNYALDVPDESAVLVFSSVGYLFEEITVGAQTVIDLVMTIDIQRLDEIVVIGYGTQKKSDLTGSVVRVDAKDFENQPMTQLTDMFAGTVAGVYSQQGTTAAGGGSLEIRGEKSLNASNYPMIVLDGVIYNGNMSDINPADVESVDILKDASSAAVYGARAAAGVIIVTTKKGTTGKPTINFSAELGVTSTTNDFKPYKGKGYEQFRRDYLKIITPDNPGYYWDDPANLSDGVSIEDWRNASDNPQDDDTQEYLARLFFYQVEIDNYNAGKEVNWYDEVINTGLRQNYDVSISGASDQIQYYWSVGYQDNEGVVTGDKFKTVRTRLNLDFEVTDWLNVGINSQFSNRDQSVVRANVNRMLIQSPYGNMFEDDGSVTWYPNTFPVENPLLNNYGQDRFNKTNHLFAALYANIKLPFDIEYRISYQPRYSFSKDYNFWPSTTITGGQSHSQGYGTRDDRSSFSYILDNIIHWKKEIGVHFLDLTLLYSVEENKGWTTLASNESFVPNENLGFHGLQFGTKPYVENNDFRTTGDAAMARLNYTLMDKYLFTASVRRDGYSAFGTENPRATFPAVAFAWKMSEENFFNVSWISQLKPRVSWGVNGNRSIGPYSALAQLSPNFYYDGTNVQVGVYNNSLANSSLVWERTEAFNIGFDLGMFEDRVFLNAEFYTAITEDLLMERQLPQITGFTDITTNLGKIGNKGIELSINAVIINNKNFSWKADLVYTRNENEILELFGDYAEIEVDGEITEQEVPDYTNEWFPGEAIDVVWDYDVVGIWQENEADEAAKYGMEPGAFKVTDVNGDFVYEALIDKQFIGYRNPKHRFGFGNNFTFLKNFTATVFIRADLGHLGEFQEAYRRGGDTFDKRGSYELPYWTPENGNNEYGSLKSDFGGYGGGMKRYFSRSFVRFQDITLSYQLPTDKSNNIGLQGLRIYGSLRNFITITDWPGWDPESYYGGDYGPMPKIATIGINFSL